MDLNSEPKNITRVRSRSTRVQSVPSGDGLLGNILNSPNECDNNKSLQGTNHHFWREGINPDAARGSIYHHTTPNNNNNINSESAPEPVPQSNIPQRLTGPFRPSCLYGRVLKDTAEILESPTSTDPDESTSPDHEHHSHPDRIMRELGVVQIADYEGSPRRLGAADSSTGLQPQRAEVGKSPSPGGFRPGFPQRVTMATTPEQLEKCDRGKEEGDEVPFDHVYEFSETRKVLSEFFDNAQPQATNIGDNNNNSNRAQAASVWSGGEPRCQGSSQDLMFLDVLSQDGSAGDHHHIIRSSKNFTLSPETTDYDSNCGDLDSFSNDLSTGPTDYGRLYTAMPVLEDGLSSGHVSDAESQHNQSAVRGDKEEVTTNEPKEEPSTESQDVSEALKEIQTAIQRVKVLSQQQQQASEVMSSSPPPRSPIWVPRASQDSLGSDFKGAGGIGGGEDEELDTDLETDRLLGQQRLENHLYEEDNNWVLRNKMNVKGTTAPSAIRHDTGSTLLPGSPTESRAGGGGDSEPEHSPQKSPSEKSQKQDSNKARNKEGFLEPAVLIEGVLFRAKYLGSTQLVCEGQPTKSTRMMQAEEAVSRIKAPEGESQPSTEVDLFISTEKIMVLNTDLKEIMMDHTLRTISYIADIGDLVVLMARRRFVPQDVDDDAPKPNRTPKMICHVFESEEAQFIAQSIGQAFQVAYMEFLKANGIEDHSFVKEMDYQEVLNSQEIFGDELEVFAKKELQKEVVVPKAKGEILGVVIVESGWGSMLPTVVIANLLASGAAARCGHLNIGDQIIAVNGLSLVGLPLSTCQNYIRNVKTQTAVKITVVPCAPVVEVKIKRPNTKYQLGFSVQNGVICSLLRGGIAERGGVRVGHRIIEINNQSVVAVPHEKIVTLLATSVGEILMKTMPTSMFRLLTGQENPLFI